MQDAATTGRKILVTGATGYIGGRLVPALLARGHTVRCLVRDPARLGGRPWEHLVEIVRGDATDYETLVPALRGVEAAYYLIHSLGAGEDVFVARDRLAARSFGMAARAAGVQRIIYLGGLQPASDRRSAHLESRIETGALLRNGGVPVTEFRAGVIVGSGSLSFELIRYLTERVPVLVTPRWVRTPAQPIAVRNVLEYLVQALDVPESTGEIVEIGGRDVLTYGEMFKRYARVRGLRRFLVRVPVLTPRLSSHWVGLVTPINNKIARPLIAGLDNEVVVRDDRAARRFDVDLLSYEEAVRLALRRVFQGDVDTAWSDARSSAPGDAVTAAPHEDAEGLIRDCHHVVAKAPPAAVFRALQQMGGDRGWRYASVLWRLRGLLDLISGGVGLRRSRRSYNQLRPGDTIDFWRVEAIEPDRLLRLHAEMKLPGEAWLQYRLRPVDGGTHITQTAFFAPKGLAGVLYWYLFYLPHRLIFPGMLRELRRRAESPAGGSSTPSPLVRPEPGL